MAYNDLNAMLGMIPKQLDVLILGYFRGPVETGYYQLAKSLSGALGFLAGPLQSVTYPELATLSEASDKRALPQKASRLAIQLGIPLGIAALAGACVLPFLLPVLVGAAYVQAIGAAEVLFIGSAIWLSCFWLRPLYLAQGRIRQWCAISLLISVLSLISYPFVISHWGYLGLANLQVLMQFTGHSLGLYYVGRIDGKHDA
jgi:O-antigen/teichoic acid export membrane protein